MPLYTGDTETRQCYCCEGRKTFDAPNVAAICDAVLTNATKAGKARRFRASLPSPYARGSGSKHDTARVYYVWSMARFHGGADVTMPMTASMAIAGDPFRAELNFIAENVAKRAFGTDLAGTVRWSGLLGKALDVPGLPASAYQGGPVADENKPDFERAELDEDGDDDVIGASYPDDPTQVDLF